MINEVWPLWRVHENEHILTSSVSFYKPYPLEFSEVPWEEA